MSAPRTVRKILTQALFLGLVLAPHQGSAEGFTTFFKEIAKSCVSALAGTLKLPIVEEDQPVMNYAIPISDIKAAAQTANPATAPATTPTPTTGLNSIRSAKPATAPAPTQASNDNPSNVVAFKGRGVKVTFEPLMFNSPRARIQEMDRYKSLETSQLGTAYYWIVHQPFRTEFFDNIKSEKAANDYRAAMERTQRVLESVASATDPAAIQADLFKPYIPLDFKFKWESYGPAGAWVKRLKEILSTGKLDLVVQHLTTLEQLLIHSPKFQDQVDNENPEIISRAMVYSLCDLYIAFYDALRNSTYAPQLREQRDKLIDYLAALEGKYYSSVDEEALARQTLESFKRYLKSIRGEAQNPNHYLEEFLEAFKFYDAYYSFQSPRAFFDMKQLVYDNRELLLREAEHAPLHPDLLPSIYQTFDILKDLEKPNRDSAVTAAYHLHAKYAKRLHALLVFASEKVEEPGRSNELASFLAQLKFVLTELQVVFSPQSVDKRRLLTGDVIDALFAWLEAKQTQLKNP